MPSLTTCTTRVNHRGLEVPFQLATPLVYIPHLTIIIAFNSLVASEVGCRTHMIIVNSSCYCDLGEYMGLIRSNSVACNLYCTI